MQGVNKVNEKMWDLTELEDFTGKNEKRRMTKVSMCQGSLYGRNGKSVNVLLSQTTIMWVNILSE